MKNKDFRAGQDSALLGVLCSIVLQLCMIPTVAQAQFSYSVDGNQVTITGYAGPAGPVTVPSTVGGLPVTAIGNGAFGSSPITSITIPDSVTYIGGWAFYYTLALTNADLGNGVTNIDRQAFLTSGLTSISIPKSVVTMGTEAFRGSQVATATVAATSLADGAFAHCQRLTQVTLLEGVTTLGSDVFYGSSLPTITLPSTVQTLGGWIAPNTTFRGCGSLTNIGVVSQNTNFSSLKGVLFDKTQTTLLEYTPGIAGDYVIPDTVTAIGNSAFFYCTHMTGIKIPNSVTNILDYAFQLCQLTNVTLPDSMVSIGLLSFAQCDNITNITIPNSLRILGSGAFQQCANLVSATIGTGVSWFSTTTFGSCPNLVALKFLGNAPILSDNGDFANLNFLTIYYLPGTSGWSGFYAERPTAPLTLPYPLILSGSAGLRNNQFGFTVSWATNLSVVVEAATDLANPIWQPLQTNTLPGGWFAFSDPTWINHISRFYRVRWP